MQAIFNWALVKSVFHDRNWTSNRYMHNAYSATNSENKLQLKINRKIQSCQPVSFSPCVCVCERRHKLFYHRFGWKTHLMCLNDMNYKVPWILSAGIWSAKVATNQATDWNWIKVNRFSFKDSVQLTIIPFSNKSLYILTRDGFINFLCSISILTKSKWHLGSDRIKPQNQQQQQ